MSNEHIGRKQALGFGKESTAGTAVAASFWVPKVSGSFAPQFEFARDESSYGTIDGLRDAQTVKSMTKVDLSAIVRDDWFGFFFLAAFGLAYPCVRFPIPGSITGTYVEGEVITEATSTATGTLRRLDAGGSSKVLYIEPLSGTFTGGQTLTGGTSGATATGGTIESPAALRHHVFRRKNDNAHPSFTIYGSDPVGDERATYCMLDTLELECVVGDFLKMSAGLMGKKLASTSTQTPSYTSGNAFLAKFASFKSASAFTGLDAASAVSVERFKLQISKNLTNYQAFGDTDVASFHNQRFDVKGDLTLIYNATTYRDYVANSTDQAMRLNLTNTDATTLGSATKPALQLDLPAVSFTEWGRTDENDGLVKQTLAFECQYDVTRAMQAEALLVNSRVTAY